MVWLVVSNIVEISHFIIIIYIYIYGMSSFPLTFTPSFFKMGTASTTNQWIFMASFLTDLCPGAAGNGAKRGGRGLAGDI